LPAWFKNQTISHPTPSAVAPPPCKALTKSVEYARALYELYAKESQPNDKRPQWRKYQQLLLLYAKRLVAGGPKFSLIVPESFRKSSGIVRC